MIIVSILHILLLFFTRIALFARSYFLAVAFSQTKSQYQFRTLPTHKDCRWWDWAPNYLINRGLEVVINRPLSAIVIAFWSFLRKLRSTVSFELLYHLIKNNNQLIDLFLDRQRSNMLQAAPIFLVQLQYVRLCLGTQANKAEQQWMNSCWLNLYQKFKNTLIYSFLCICCWSVMNTIHLGQLKMLLVLSLEDWLTRRLWYYSVLKIAENI